MAKVYYKVVIARGETRAVIQLPSYHIEADSYELAKDRAEDLAEQLTHEHGILPDRYWVAYMALMTEEKVFLDPRLDASIDSAH